MPTDATNPADDDLSPRQGWLLVGALALAGLVIPAIIYAEATDLGVLGLPYWHTLVALPMIPAVLLGLIGVWSAIR